MRLPVLTSPLIGPYLRKACIPYSEQVGVKRQALGRMGEMTALYNLISRIKKLLSSCFMLFKQTNQKGLQFFKHETVTHMLFRNKRNQEGGLQLTLFKFAV